jgi:lipopolysaccharide export system protein LptA
MRPLRAAAVVIVWALVIGLLYLGALRLRSVDPFSQYRQTFNAAMESPWGVVLDDVDVAAYEGGVPLARFHVSEIDVRRDEREVLLKRCDRGILYDEGKQAAQFSALLVKWDTYQHVAQISGQVHIRRENMDVHTSALVWREKESLLTFSHPLVGTFEGGAFHALNAKLNLAEESAELFEGSWKGQLKDKQEASVTKGSVLFRFHKASKEPNSDVIVFLNAEMVDEEDRFFRADRIEYNEKTEVAVCTGNCAVRTERIDATGDKAVVERKIEKATLTENIAVTLWPKPEDIEAAEQPPEEGEPEEPLHSRRLAKARPLKIVCDRIEYFYGDEPHAVLTGSLYARQDVTEEAWREITAARAVLDEDKETLSVDGDVKMIASNGDRFDVESLVVSTKEGDDAWTVGPGTGETVAPEEKEPGEAAGP